jgi:ribosome biogenesis GTPase
LTDMARGRIQKALSGFYYVNTGTEVLTCRARGKFRKTGQSPLVGDWVEVRELGGGEGFVEEILPRRNAFARPAVANIDQLVIIGSGAIPRTDPFLIDRVTAIAALKHCDVLVVLNKCDLDPAEDLYRIYTASGIPTLRLSAETGEGLDRLQEAIVGKLSAFTGNSGVGKSSILNALEPEFRLQVGEVSDALGRGRHTTRHVELYHLSCGADVVDSPGFSSFETDELNLELKEHLPETFREFEPYLGQCRFVGCSHTKEAGCAVLDALRSGKIQQSRHASYVRLYEELKPLRAWQERKK